MESRVDTINQQTKSVGSLSHKWQLSPGSERAGKKSFSNHSKGSCLSEVSINEDGKFLLKFPRSVFIPRLALKIPF